MFYSNVAPKVKKIVRDAKTWLCQSCSRENAHYLTRCHGCNERRRT